jgi:hypothetical protein
MANVTECIEKLATGGQITRKIADEALEFSTDQRPNIQSNYAAPVKAESPPSAFVHAVPEIVRE